jgi:hypothetical protein
MWNNRMKPTWNLLVVSHIKFAPVQAERGGGTIDPTNLKSRKQKWLGVQQHASAASFPGQIGYPFYGTLFGPRSRSGRVWKISLESVFDPLTCQPLASCCIDYAIQVTLNHINSGENVRKVFQSKTEEEGSQEIRTQCELEIDARITYVALREEANKETLPVLRTCIESRQSQIKYLYCSGKIIKYHSCPEAVTATKFNKILPGRQPRQVFQINRHFKDRLRLHYQVIVLWNVGWSEHIDPAVSPTEFCRSDPALYSRGTWYQTLRCTVEAREIRPCAVQ